GVQTCALPVAAVPDGAAMAAAADAALAPLVPAGHQPWEDTAALVERVAADPAFLTVADLAREAGTTARELQRRFADHVGLGPKAVIRRYRLYEARSEEHTSELQSRENLVCR